MSFKGGQSWLILITVLWDFSKFVKTHIFPPSWLILILQKPKKPFSDVLNWFQESNMMPIHLSYNSSHLPLSFTWSQVRVFRKLLNQSKLQIVIKLPITGFETSNFNTQSFKNRLCQYRTRLDMKTVLKEFDWRVKIKNKISVDNFEYLSIYCRGFGVFEATFMINSTLIT